MLLNCFHGYMVCFHGYMMCFHGYMVCFHGCMVCFHGHMMCFHALQELDKKFSETAQFVNMKKMLTSKNDQIKKLRAKLEQ